MPSKLCPKCRRFFDEPLSPRCESDGWRLIDDRHHALVAGRYSVLSFLGVGAAGEVWEAIDQEVGGRRVALKLVAAKDVGEAQRFERGARLVAGLKHPNVTATLAFGKDGDGEDALLWIVMELLDGETLAELLARVKTLDARAAVAIVGEVLLGLEQAHASNIVHRDMKPSNVFITTSGVAKILDFGIAKQAGASNERALEDTADGDDYESENGGEVTGKDKICGTPEYMPPEQILGAPADVRSDLYAVGVMLYKLVSGAVPFRARSRSAVYHQHLHATVAPLVASDAVPQAFIDVVMKALAKPLDERFPSARALHEALRAAVGLPSLPVGPPVVDLLALEAEAAEPDVVTASPVPLVRRPKPRAQRAAVVFFCVSLVVLLTVLATKISSF